MNERLLQLIRDKVMRFINLEEADHERWKNGDFLGYEKQYRIYDNEWYEFAMLTKEEYDLLKEFTEAPYK